MIVAFAFIGVWFSRANAFDIVSSPTPIQKWYNSIYDERATVNFESSFWSWYLANQHPMSVYFNWSNIYTFPAWWNVVAAWYCDPFRFWAYKEYVYCQLLTNLDGYHQGIIIDTKNSIVSPFYSLGWPYPGLGGWFQINDDRVFISDRHIFVFNGTNILQYSISTQSWSISYELIQTIPKPSPGFNIKSVANWFLGILPLPVYLSWHNDTKFFAYQWTDNNPYKVLDTFESGSDLPITTQWEYTAVPIGKFYNNDIILARQWSSHGSLYVWDAASATPLVELSNDYTLSLLNTFSNPVAYFTASGWTVVKWDLNCIYPWYNSCRESGGSFKCTNTSWTLSPWWETCGGVLSPTTPGGWTGAISAPSSPENYWKKPFEIIYGNDSLTCFNKSFQNALSATFPWIWFFHFSWDTASLTWTTGQIILGDSSGNQDSFIYSNVNYGVSTIDPESLKWSGNTLSVLKDFTTNSKPIEIEIRSTRNYDPTPFNYIRIKTNIGTNTNQAHQWTGGRFWFKTWTGYEYSTFFSSSWWYITALAPPWVIANGRWLLESYVAFNFYSIEIWIYWWWSDNLIECRNGHWFCEIQQNLINNSYDCIPEYIKWNATGSCGFINNSGSPICLPTTPIADAAYSGAVYDKNGNYPIQTWTGANAGITYEWEDIFSCSETWISVLICPFQVLGKVWAKFTFVIKKLLNLIYGISSLGSPHWQGNIFSFIVPSANAEAPHLATPFDRSWSWNSSNSYTWSDMMNLNKSILAASDNVYNMDSKGIKWIYALSMWFLILVGVVFVIVIFLIAFL